VIWLLAGLALYYGSQWNAESTEPYFQLASAAVIIGLALWMAWRTHRDIKAEARHKKEHEHGHSHSHSHPTAGYQDAHELAHAVGIRKRLAGGAATLPQIALFGFTGGLLPCPAAFTIVLVCLQLKRFALGIAMVLAFSAGLALTLVATGALAAWGLRHAEKRFSGFGAVARKLPYLSSGILTLMGLFIGIQGWLHLTQHH
jgi:ABC-type nickel/cobalt efflux system permease component RcnA